MVDPGLGALGQMALGMIQHSNPQSKLGAANQQASQVANAMAVAPSYMNILGSIPEGPSPTANPNAMNVAMPALGAGAAGGQQAPGGVPGIENAPRIQPHGAPEALSAAMQPTRAPQQTYWAQLAAGFPRSGFGG